MSLLSRLAVVSGLAVRSEPVPTPTPAGVMPPARDAYLLGVTPRDALALDSVYRAVSIIQTACLQLTVDVWRGPVPLTPTPSVIARPDLYDTPGGFWASTAACLAFRGNAYWLKHKGPTGAVASVEVLDPLSTMPYRDDRGRTRFACPDGIDRGRDDVQHLRLLRVPGELLGLGPIQAAARGLRGHLDVAAYGSTWFREGEVPSGVLSTDQPLTATQAGEWRGQWKASRVGGETAILGNGLKYEHLGLKPSEVQWLESQRFGTQAVARLFGIPSRQMLVAIEGGSTSYANAEQEDISFVRYTLMAYLREIEMALSDLLPRGQVARFNTDGLLRTDTKTRYEALAVAIGAGILSPAEARAIEGLPPDMPAATPAPTPSEVP